MPRLVIVIGANGAGKSTWCHHHRRQLPVCFYDADSIAQGLGSYDDASHQRDARVWVDRCIEEHLAAGESFGFESTYSGASRPGLSIDRAVEPLPPWAAQLAGAIQHGWRASGQRGGA